MSSTILRFNDQISHHVWWVQDMIKNGSLVLEDNETIHYLAEVDNGFVFSICEKLLDKPVRPVVIGRTLFFPKTIGFKE